MTDALRSTTRRPSEPCVLSRRAGSRGRIVVEFVPQPLIVCSLIGTAKLNGLNPEAYLRHVLERIADRPITRIQELLPRNLTTLLTASAPAA